MYRIYIKKLTLGLLTIISLDVCVITETWLKEGRGSEFKKVIKNDEYEWFSRERNNQKARSGEGGIGMLIKKKLGKAQIVKGSKLYESMWIEIETNSCKIYLAAVYM